MSGLLFSRVSVMHIISGKTANCKIKLTRSSKFFVKIECLYVKEKVHWNLTLELKTVCHSRSMT